MNPELLSTFCRLQSGLLLVPSRIYDGGKCIESVGCGETQEVLCKIYIPRLLECESCSEVRLYLSQHGLLFGSVEDSETGRVMVIGPAKAMEIDEAGIRRILAGARIGATDASMRNLRECLDSMRCVPLETSSDG